MKKARPLLVIICVQVSDKIVDKLIFFFLAENAIENMVGPDWKKRWLYWKNRTQEQVK